MSTKTLIGVVAVVIVVVAVAAVAVSSLNSDDENAGYTGVIYDGNGGKTLDGNTTFRLTSHTVMSNMFTNGSYVFVGWNTAADGSGQAYEAGSNIDYADHTYVRLYAQWANSINLTLSYTDCQLAMVDSSGKVAPLTSGGNALPSDGMATIVVIAPEGTVWTKVSEGRYQGVNGNVHYSLSYELENATVQAEEVPEGSLNLLGIQFTYTGNVSGSIFISQTTVTPTN